MRGIKVLYGVVLFLAAGCDFFVPLSSDGSGSNNGDYLYAGNGNNRFIAGFGVATSGALSALPSSPYNNGVAVLSAAISPGNRFLYAGTTAGIFVYAINSDGSLTVQDGGNVAAQDVVPTAMQVDSTGGYLRRPASQPRLLFRELAFTKLTALRAC
jgi:myo-inositol-hexaphosphate 3-phosphohydrolase